MIRRRNFLLGSVSAIAITGFKQTEAAIGRGVAVSGTGVSGITTLGTVTMQDLSGSTRTGTIPVSFVYPLGASDLPIGTTLVAYDGVTALDTQQVTVSSDRNGKTRLFHGMAMWRGASLTANTSKQLTIKRVSGSAPTGTAITDADILSTDYGIPVTITLGGLTYTADARDILSASGTWSGTNNSGNPWRAGTYCSGPYLTEIKGSTPLKTGGVAHAFLRMQVTIHAVKANSGAYNASTNPILYIKTHLEFENQYLFVASPADLFYGAQIQVGHASPVNITSDANNPGNIDLTTLTPADSLTITGTAATRVASSWTNDDVGRIIEHIASGNRARIVAVSSGTSATISYFRGAGWDGAFAQGTLSTAIADGTYTSGQWKQYGVGHMYRGQWYAKIWWGGNADHVALADWTQIRASKVFPNWTAPLANYRTADMTLLNAEGVAATRYKRPFRGNAVNGGSFGDLPTDISEGGQDGTEYLNVAPAWFHRLMQQTIGSAEWLNDLRKCEENAQAFMTMEYCSRYEGSGTPLDFTNAVVPLNDIALHAATSSHHPTVPAARATYVDWVEDNGIENPSHQADPHFPMWFITGDSIWIDQLHKYIGWIFLSTANAATGTGRNVFAAGVVGGIIQDRAIAWATRTTLHSIMATPDNWSCDEYTKTFLNAYLDAGMSAANTAFVLDTTNWSADGPKTFTGFISNNDYAFSAYQAGYHSATWIHAIENALLDTNGLAVARWFLKSVVAAGQTTGANALNIPQAAGRYFSFIKDTVDGKNADATMALTFARLYEQGAKGIGLGIVGNFNDLNLWQDHGVAITGVSGIASSRVLTVSPAYFFGSYHVGGWVITTSDGGVGLITAGSADGLSVTVDTTVTTAGGYQKNGAAIAGPSYATATIQFPAPAPGHWPSSLFLINPLAGSGHPVTPYYWWRFVSGCGALVDMETEGDTAFTGAATALANFKHHWEVDGAGYGVGNLPADYGSTQDAAYVAGGSAAGLFGGGSGGNHYTAQWAITPRGF